MILLVLTLFSLSACATVFKSKYEKIDTLEIKGSFYINRNYYSEEDLSKGIYHNSEIILGGKFKLPSIIQKNNTTTIKTKIFLDSLQNTKLKSLKAFECYFSENIYSFETSLNKYDLKDLGINLNADSLKMSGWYVISGDTAKRPIEINFQWDVVYNIEFVSLESGEIEEELGIGINRESITSLQLNLNHPEIKNHLHLLPKLTGIENLEIQGTRSLVIPAVLFKLEHLDSVNISELYDLGIDHQPNESVLLSPLIFPMQFLTNPSLRSIRIAGAKVEIKEEFPKSSKLKSLYFKSYQLDSLPNSILNLSFLEIIDFTYGQIEYSIPENLNQLSRLKVMKICLPKGIVPKGFGPWTHLNQLFIFVTIDSITKKALLINNSDLNYLVNTLKADTSYINGEYFYK